jgi:hypothetical protein
MKPRYIRDEPRGRYMLSVNGTLMDPDGLALPYLIKAASYIAGKHRFIVFPNGVKVHTSAISL